MDTNFKPTRPVLQIPVDYIKRDSDGYFLFPLPITVWIQQLDGKRYNGKYLELTIKEDGTIELKRGG